MRLLDSRFRYIPAARTDVGATWRRFGFRPTTESERRARQRANPSGADDTSPVASRDIELAPPRLAAKSGAKPSLKLAR
jgi:hypothetical protein